MSALLESAEWMAQAACLSVDPEVFFPEVGGHGTADEAKRICTGCPVRQHCLDWALSLPETEGVWGGMTPVERREMRRDTGMADRTPAICGSPSGYERHRRNGEASCEPCKRAHNARKRQWRKQRQRGAA